MGVTRGVVTLLVKRHITQVVSRDPVIRCSPVPALSSAIHVTISVIGGHHYPPNMTRLAGYHYGVCSLLSASLDPLRTL